MLYINKQIFESNLKLTQLYCELQLKKEIKDNAKVFRSYNPDYGKIELFSFQTQRYEFEIEPGVRSCTLTKWAIDPTDRESVVNNLFLEQINNKKQLVTVIKNGKIHSGRILVSEIDCTVIDGASEVQSLGLIDVYDIPPIDTWFYIEKTKRSRLLFSWIPTKYEFYANEAINVNCVGCMDWADVIYPDRFDKYLYEELIKTNNNINEKPSSFWLRIKRWLSD